MVASNAIGVWGSCETAGGEFFVAREDRLYDIDLLDGDGLPSAVNIRLSGLYPLASLAVIDGLGLVKQGTKFMLTGLLLASELVADGLGLEKQAIMFVLSGLDPISLLIIDIIGLGTQQPVSKDEALPKFESDSGSSLNASLQFDWLEQSNPKIETREK